MIRLFFLFLLSISLYADNLEFNLKSFAELVSTQNKINILVDDALLKNDNFSFYLQSDKEIVLLKAFKQMLATKQLVLTHKGDFYYIKKDWTILDPNIFLPRPKFIPKLYAIKLDSLVFSDFKPFLDSYKDNNFTYSYIKNTNSIFLKCDPKIYNEINSFILKNDKKAEQFQIKISIIETDDNFAKERGSDISLYAKNSNAQAGYFVNLFTMGTSPTVSLSSNIGLNASLHFLDTIGVSKILTSPYFTVESGKTVHFSNADTIPFQTGTSQTNGATQTTNNSVTYKDIGLVVDLTPTVVNDTIFMDLNFTNESIVDDTTLTPKTTKTAINTSFQLKHHGIQVLTGLNIDKKVKNNYGIPFLMHLPYIGQVFQMDTQTHDKKTISVIVEID